MPFWDELQKANRKEKHKFKKNNSWPFFNALNLVLSYLLTYLGK
jgi:hypothetical protein